MMQDRLYLLDIEELTEDDGQAPALFQRAAGLLDEERLRKYARLRGREVRAASLGAGLLIQLAVAERELSAAFFRCLGVGELLKVLEESGAPLQIAYDYGEHGKPYLRDYPLQFSLSHSGRYVLCAASEQEIGADIQRMRPLANFRVAERFFAPDEIRGILQGGEKARQEQAFYRLWTRKEAYGKLTGEGIVPVAGRDLSEAGQGLQWLECPEVEGYQLSVCRHQL